MVIDDNVASKEVWEKLYELVPGGYGWISEVEEHNLEEDLDQVLVVDLEGVPVWEHQFYAVAHRQHSV